MLMLLEAIHLCVEDCRMQEQITKERATGKHLCQEFDLINIA
jgi:hypothetical protein